MLLLDTWPLTHLFWLVPLLFALHNAEEAPRMAEWARTVEARFMPVVSTMQFTVGVALLTLLVTGITIFAVYSLPARLRVPLMTGVQAIIFVNAFTHIGATVRYRRYSPGLVTAVLLNLPFSLLLFYWALATDHLSWRGLLIALILAPMLMVALARGALEVGRAVAH